jgi:hypothetical protein
MLSRREALLVIMSIEIIGFECFKELNEANEDSRDV